MSSNEAGVTSHVLAVAGHGVCEIHEYTCSLFSFQKQSGCDSPRADFVASRWDIPSSG